jgi:hypothetical protein
MLSVNLNLIKKKITNMCLSGPELNIKKITNEGLKISLKDKGKYIMKGKNIITTQGWELNTSAAEQFKGLVAETHVIGSCKEPGLIVDAMREGAKVGLAI